MTVDNTEFEGLDSAYRSLQRGARALLNIADNACYGIVSTSVLQLTFAFFCYFLDALVSHNPISFHRVMWWIALSHPAPRKAIGSEGGIPGVCLQQVACCPGTSRRESERMGVCWVFAAHCAFLWQTCPYPGATSQCSTAGNTKAFHPPSCLASRMPGFFQRNKPAFLPEAMQGWGDSHCVCPTLQSHLTGVPRGLLILGREGYMVNSML